MAKKSKKNTIALATNGGALLFGVLVIVSMFMAYTVGKISGETWASGFELLKNEDSNSQVFIVVSLILAIAVAALAVLRLLGMFDGGLFNLLFAIAGVVLVVFGIIILIKAGSPTGNDNFNKLYEAGIGAILNLVFSILAGLCCIAGYVKSK